MWLMMYFWEWWGFISFCCLGFMGFVLGFCLLEIWCCWWSEVSVGDDYEGFEVGVCRCRGCDYNEDGGGEGCV